MTKKFAVRIRIPQDSSLSSIFYLFNNADLLDICDQMGINASFLGYVDNVNILVYEKSSKKNYITLEIIHKKCEKWTNQLLHKNKLIHLSKSFQFNMSAVTSLKSAILSIGSWLADQDSSCLLSLLLNMTSHGYQV